MSREFNLLEEHEQETDDGMALPSSSSSEAFAAAPGGRPDRGLDGKVEQAAATVDGLVKDIALLKLKDPDLKKVIFINLSMLLISCIQRTLYL